MNRFIETFAEIENYISANALVIEVKETLDAYTQIFEMSYSHILHLNGVYDQLAFSNYLVSLTFHVPSQVKPLLYDEFLRLAPLLFKKDPNEIINVELKVDKDSAFKLESNEFLFFENKMFYELFRYHNQQIFERINTTEYIKIYLPIQLSYKNDFLLLLPHSDHPSNDVKISDEASDHLDKIVKAREESCRISPWLPVPEMFLMKSVADSELKYWFDQNLFGVSLCHIGNKSNDTNGLIIRGNKNIEINLDGEFAASNAINIHNIYKFAYEEKHQSDKIEIARNVITIYLNTADDASKLNELAPTIEKTIRNHFTAYVQDSIKKFFNDRKDVIKEAHKFASDIKSEADKLITYINASFIGIITAIFTGSLGLSKGERWFLLLAFGLHALAFFLGLFVQPIICEKEISRYT